MAAKHKIIPYNPNLKELAKRLRSNMTLSEVLLWNELKKKKMFGYDFDRQRPINNYIVDFYCKELCLAIEIDGDTHIYKYDYDEERQRALEKLGVNFLRFEDIEVKRNMSNVLRVIENWIQKNKPTPGPSQEGNQADNTSNLFIQEEVNKSDNQSSKIKKTNFPEGNQADYPSNPPIETSTNDRIPLHGGVRDG